MTTENLTVEAYLNDAALRGQIERQARRERAAAVQACSAGAIATLRRLVQRTHTAGAARPVAL